MKDGVTVIVPAAGIGKRLGLGKNKAFALVGGLPLLALCLKNLSAVAVVNHVVVVVGAGEVEATRQLLTQQQERCFPRLSWEVTAGGKERQDSVANGLACVTAETGYVAVHDGARPFADAAVFNRTLAKAKQYGAAIAAVPSKDTVKIVREDGLVASTPERSTLRNVQTPQIFEIGLLRRAYANVKKHPFAVTDDASLVEALGEPVAVAEGAYENIKITTPEDILVAEEIIARRVKETREEMQVMQFRVGTGFDVHCLVQGRPLILLGVTIPCAKGLLGYSDADVALHALTDALLGAAGLGDIGRHFPDTDPRYKGADSRKLLREALRMIQAKGWRVNNVDVTIIAQAPKLAAFIPQMQALVAEDLQVAPDAVNVKATTTEKLGFAGRGEGIAAEAVASLIQA